MKLNPPASSSDLDVAREVARRLHQRRRREDRPQGGPPRAERPAAPPLPPRRAEPQPAPAAAHAPAAHAPAAPARPSAPAWEPPAPPVPDFGEPPADVLPPPPAEEPGPPTWDVPSAQGFEGNQEPEDALEALTAGSEPTPDGPPDTPGPAIEIEEEAAAPSRDDEPAAFDEADAFGGAPAPTPFDDADALAAPDIETELPSPEPSDESPFDPQSLGVSDATPDEEELFDETPGRPSWGELAEGCRRLAHARGALIADPAGELIAARGEWPEPGAEAIATRLVAMMDRTLRDAPTRSVSAPVGSLHLTAWRVPVDARLLTVVFIADAQVRADTRPVIDAEVQRGSTGA